MTVRGERHLFLNPFTRSNAKRIDKSAEARIRLHLIDIPFQMTISPSDFLYLKLSFLKKRNWEYHTRKGFRTF